MTGQQEQHQDAQLLVKGDKVIEKIGNKVISEKDYSHVISGYKATLHRQGVSEEARQHAQEMLTELEKSHQASIGQGATHEHHSRHYKNVVRGLKASLHNPHVSDEAKQGIKQRLHEMGEHE
ncbi:hypothetical protein OIO90_003830 [Microbotryomycetes sp. JL221]|nr:hypothetical protein OIO90_003830 [Microbotryomycetes sp. JL221]